MHFESTTALKTRHQNKSTNINNYTQDDMRVTVLLTNKIQTRCHWRKKNPLLKWKKKYNQSLIDELYFAERVKGRERLGRHTIKCTLSLQIQSAIHRLVILICCANSTDHLRSWSTKEHVYVDLIPARPSRTERGKEINYGTHNPWSYDNEILKMLKWPLDKQLSLNERLK